MAQYDGSIRINTNISTKDAKAQLGALQHTIVKTADEIASLRSRMDAMKDTKIPTELYKQLGDYVRNTEASVEKLTKTLKQMEAEGNTGSYVYENYKKTIEKFGVEIKNSKEMMQELVNTGRAFTLGKDTDEYRGLAKQLEYEQKALAKMTAQYVALGGLTTIEKAQNAFRKLGNVAKNALFKIAKFAKRSDRVISSFGSRLKSLAVSALIFNQIGKAFNSLSSAIKTGFSNLYKYVGGFKNSVDSLKASALTLKNALAAAFRPLVETAIPYIQKTVEWITVLLDKLGQFIALASGQKTYTKAIKQTADAFKDAKKAADGYLNPLDEINKYKDMDSADNNNAAMFEEVPVDSYFTNLAQKIKDIFSQLFTPLKEAWSREGRSVMNSWKSALKEIGSLIGSIGSDFLEVWQQEKTIGIFEDILHIVGAISFAVSNLGRNFRLAWEENKTGKRILEGIRDIIAVITENIRHAADVTAEWAKNIDFSPFLTRLQGWIESLTPVFDILSGIVTDFYEHVLLPLGKWTLEKGLPELLQVLTDFNSKIDWESIRKRLTEFWKHLEPFAEAVGEGLIIFIGKLSDALADFINSPAFEKFLNTIENWMDRVSAEDVANGLKMICKSILGYKALSSAFSVISFGAGVLSKLFSVLKFFGVGGGAAKAASAIGETGEAVTGLGESAGALPGILGNVVNSIGFLGVGIQSLQQVSKNASMDEIFDVMTKAADLLKQELNNGVISMEEYESQMKKLGDAANLAGLKNDSESIANFNTVLDEINGNLLKTSGSLDEFGEKAIEVGDNISTGLTSGFDSVDVETPIKGIFNRIIANIKNLFGIHSPSTVMQEMGVYIIQGLLNGISSLAGNVIDRFSNIKKKIRQKWEETKANTVNAWNNMKATVATASANIFGDVKNKFSSIQGALSSFSSAAQNIWSNTWSAMKDKAGSMLESIKNVIGSAFDWISDRVSSILSKIGSVSSKSSAIKGSASSAFSVQPAAIPAVASLSNFEIPRLATGTVIPANREFLAVLGDQKHGTNIEAPLDTIEQASERAILKVLSQLGVAIGGGGSVSSSRPIELKLMVNRHELGRVMVEEGTTQLMSTGKNMFMLGLT